MTTKSFVIGANGIEEITNTPLVKVNQILVSHHPCGVTRHVVIDIVQDRNSGVIYKTVNLKTGEHDQKDYIKPLSKMGGIGTYYNDAEPEFMHGIEVGLFKMEADRKTEEKKREAEEQHKQIEHLKTIGRERLTKLLPEDMQALIVAEEKENQSDSMTDLFYHTTGRTVILGYSKTKRNDFNEMRKMASRFEGTKHLAEYNTEYEHRENYTGGGGYYLGTSRHSGWEVRKVSYRTREQFIEAYAALAGNEDNVCFSDVKTPAPQTTQAQQTEGIRIVDYSEKAIAVIGETKPIKETLSDLKGSFNSRLTVNGEKVCGWIFPKKRKQEVRTALSL